MAFLTAMTMAIGAMGVTAYAEGANTAVVTESVQTDGVFSQGAEYHFIKGSDALILDGEGSFTVEEFDEVVKQLSPRTVVFGDNVNIPNDEWLKSILQLSAPYAVYTHDHSRVRESLDSIIGVLEDDLERQGLDPDKVKIWLYYQLSYLKDNVDIYKNFTYNQDVVDRGNEMEKYLEEHDIEKDIAREIVSYYMYGLNCRVNRGLNNPTAKEVANPDGTEINEITKNHVYKQCLRAAESERELVYNKNSKATGEVSKFLAENGIADNENKRLTLIYVRGAKSLLAFSCSNVKYNSYNNDKTEMQLTTEVTDAVKQAVTEAITEAETQAATVVEENTKEDDAVRVLTDKESTAIKGDLNGDGAVTYRDAAILVMLLANLKNENVELPECSDFNNDGIINIRDAAKIIDYCKENGSLGEEYKNMVAIPVKKGDANLDGMVDLSDLTAIAKYNLSNEAYPLKNDVAFVNADMNNDDTINGVDTSALIEKQLGKK